MKGTRVYRLIFALTYALLSAIFTPTPMWAQIDTGGVTGTILDSTGAAEPGAQITLTNVATGVAQVVHSTAAGTYSFEAVPPGTYTLQATASGFQTYVLSGIQVHVQQIATANIPLTIGKVQQQVIVTSAAPLLQAQDASLGQTISTAPVNDLPLVNRNWVSLSQLSAGVATAPVGQPSADSGTTGSAYFSVNGVNFWQNDIRLDGIDDNIEIYGGNVIETNATITPPPDAIEEFKVQSGDFNAEFGHSTGGVINAVIKSGTNSFHGDLWEYLRNDAFDANDYFSNQRGLPKPEYRQNEFGGTIGGPIYRNKTFFFADYQGERIIIPSPATRSVPTPGMADSGFTNLQDLITYNSGTATDGLGRTLSHGTVLDPATTREVAAGEVDPISGLVNSSSNSIYVRDPFYTGSLVGMKDFTGVTAQLNQIPASRLDPNAVKLLGVYPAPNGAGLINNYFANPKETEDNNQYDIRIDQNFSPKNILFGVFDRSYMTNTVPGVFPGVASGQTFGGLNDFPAYAVAVGYTHVFTPTLTNEIHFGLDHSFETFLSPYGNTFGIPAQYGIQGIPQVAGTGGLPPINISGLGGIGVSAYIPTVAPIHAIEVSDNVTKIYGKHQFKMGFQIDELSAACLQPPYGRGGFTFNGQYSDIPNQNSSLLGVADLLLTPEASTVGGPNDVGGAQAYSGSNVGNTDDNRHYLGAYFQDDWKITEHLTLNLGLRWDYFSPYAEVNGRQANFIANGGNGPMGRYYMSNKGCAVPRSGSFDALLASNGIQLDCVPGLNLGNAQPTNFAPRLGFAYQVRPLVVVRGGYGIAYGALGNVGYGGTLGTNYPFEYTINATSTSSQSPLQLSNGATATIEDTFSTINLSDPTEVSGAGVTLFGRQYNYQTPYTQTFNLATQYQFTNRDAVQVGYVGTLGRHLDIRGTANNPTEILPPGVSQTPFLPFPSFAPGGTYVSTNASSNYNSLQTTYQHQFNDGLMLLANYTFSKCLSDQRTEASTLPAYRAQWLPGFGIRADSTLCDADAANLAHVAGTYAVPIGRRREFLSSISRPVDEIIGGWYVNFIYSYQSGQPFNVPCATPTTSDFGCNATKVPGQNLYAGPHNATQWLNPNAFGQPPVATQIGQSDYSVLGSPGGFVRGPSLSNLDSSIFKNFSAPRETTLQFRAEAFNTFNTPQFGQPGNLNFTNPTQFSSITTLRGQPRRLQFALKYIF
jgi:Carboxypeptidase regulatory-like domain/TonB dependent receptor